MLSTEKVGVYFFRIFLKTMRILPIANQHRLQRNNHHVVEAGLALRGRHLLLRADVVGHGTNHRSLGAVLSRLSVNARRFHFNPNNAVLLHRVKQAGIGVVEQIR